MLIRSAVLPCFSTWSPLVGQPAPMAATLNVANNAATNQLFPNCDVWQERKIPETECLDTVYNLSG